MKTTLVLFAAVSSLVLAFSANSSELVSSEASVAYNATWATGGWGCNWSLDEAAGPEFDEQGVENTDCSGDWAMSLSADGGRMRASASERDDLGNGISRNFELRLLASIVLNDTTEISVSAILGGGPEDAQLTVELIPAAGDPQSLTLSEVSSLESAITAGPGEHEILATIHVSQDIQSRPDWSSYFPAFESEILFGWSGSSGVPVKATNWGGLKALYR